MKLLDMSMNIITLGALTLAVGMLVDNSVVVLENIFRHNRMGLGAKEAAVHGSREVGLAVMASTLTSVVVYLPIAVSGRHGGMLFKDFCFTIIGALAVSADRLSDGGAYASVRNCWTALCHRIT